MKNITIFGTGYVGLVTGVCLAELGNTVICVDIDQQKLDNLKKGIIPFYEVGLEELIQKNSSKLTFTTDGQKAIAESEIIFIAVGTPQNPDGSCNLDYVYTVAETIGKSLKDKKTIVIKSTIPVGTGDEVERIIKKYFSKKVAVVSNPEFLREGSAINDFMFPDRVVIGANDMKDAAEVKKLYALLDAKILLTDRASSELIKYAANAFLATKISFINSIANLSEKVGADITKVSEGIGSDTRIGNKFLNAGVGYGGSCFPKDVKALLHLGRENGLNLHLLQSVDTTNEQQKLLTVIKLKEKIDLSISRVAILGLSFKPNTDDIREAPSLTIIKDLLTHGAEVWAWDPLSEKSCERIIPNVHYCPSPYEAIEGADAAIVVTEWNELKQLNLKKVKKIMRNPLIIDGRNILNKQKAGELGIEYIGIGR